MKDRLSRRTVWEGRILQVNVDRVQLPNGTQTELEFIHHPGASAVLPLHADGTITLVRQYRYAAGGFILEAPAGKLDPGESPEQCARREVQEEAGLLPGLLTPLGMILTTPGFTDERIHLFAATSLTPVPQALESDEILELKRMPLADALALVASGGITDGKTLCALMRLEQELKSGRLRATA
jgi:ADP-ribose pyrophosphatase